MFLFGTAGGGGEAGDLCFFFPAYVSVVATALLALTGLLLRAAWASIAAVIVTGITGAFVLLAVATYKPSNDPDELGSAAMLTSLLWWWVTATSITGLSAAVAAFRSWASRCESKRSNDEQRR